MRQLAELCEHGKFESHQVVGKVRHGWCSGGQLVPADARMVSGEAIVIEKVDGVWPDWVMRIRILEILANEMDALVSLSDPTKTEPPKDPWDYDP